MKEKQIVEKILPTSCHDVFMWFGQCSGGKSNLQTVNISGKMSFKESALDKAGLNDTSKTIPKLNINSSRSNKSSTASLALTAVPGVSAPKQALQLKWNSNDITSLATLSAEAADDSCMILVSQSGFYLV